MYNVCSFDTHLKKSQDKVLANNLNFYGNIMVELSYIPLNLMNVYKKKTLKMISITKSKVPIVAN